MLYHKLANLMLKDKSLKIESNLTINIMLEKEKIDEIKSFIEFHDIDVVVTNDELTTAQSKTLNDNLGIKIIDRTQLILEIFALRARSREGKLQVELAQLDYLLPRLHGHGKSLSRLGGGIGTRGPGETKLEMDRRHIRTRMNEIKHQLKRSWIIGKDIEINVNKIKFFKSL